MSFFDKSPQRRSNLFSLLAKIFSGILLILFVGIVLFAALFVIMFFI